MTIENILGETISGFIVIYKSEKIESGTLSYNFSYDRIPGRISMENMTNIREVNATLTINRSILEEDGAWLQSNKGIDHHFRDGVYATSKPFFNRTRGFPALPRAIKNFHIPKRIKEYLKGLNDPFIEMAIRKYLK